MGPARPQPLSRRTPDGYRHRVPVLSTCFREPESRMLFGQARLYGDRIELASWRLSGRRKRSIRLEQIMTLDYHPLENGSNLSVVLDDGRTVRLHVKDAHVWREYFENWLRYDVLPRAKLVESPDEALALSG